MLKAFSKSSLFILFQFYKLNTLRIFIATIFIQNLSLLSKVPSFLHRKRKPSRGSMRKLISEKTEIKSRAHQFPRGIVWKFLHKTSIFFIKLKFIKGLSFAYNLFDIESSCVFYYSMFSCNLINPWWNNVPITCQRVAFNFHFHSLCLMLFCVFLSFMLEGITDM